MRPLYLYGNKSEGSLGLEEAKRPNWTPAFAEFLKTYHCQNPERLLAYMYAVLYAPSYRSAYGEDLSYDYPRIPFTRDAAKFAALADLGQRLIDLHLLKSTPQASAGYPVDGGHMVDKPVWRAEGRTPEVPSLQATYGATELHSGMLHRRGCKGAGEAMDARNAAGTGCAGAAEAEGNLYINDTQYFSGVPKEVWEYQIGGYQVLDKYLKARRGRALTLDEIAHFQRICGILADTIALQKEIDTVKEVW